jgi:hypothetical protein
MTSLETKELCSQRVRMPRFVAPKLQANDSAAQSVDDSVGALNSGSVPEPSGSRIPKSRSTVSLALPPPAHPLSRRTTPQPSTVRIDDLLHVDAADEGVHLLADNDENGGNGNLEHQAGGEEDHYHVSAEDSMEEELSEEQLRKLFEDEEIERFLRHFTAVR